MLQVRDIEHNPTLSTLKQSTHSLSEIGGSLGWIAADIDDRDIVDPTFTELHETL
jgi:hypothetical protein